MKPENSKKTTRESWRPDPDVAEMLEAATQSGLFTLTDIVNEALRIHGPDVLKKMSQQQRQRLDELDAKMDGKTKGAKKR